MWNLELLAHSAANTSKNINKSVCFVTVPCLNRHSNLRRKEAIYIETFKSDHDDDRPGGRSRVGCVRAAQGGSRYHNFDVGVSQISCRGTGFQPVAPPVQPGPRPDADATTVYKRPGRIGGLAFLFRMRIVSFGFALSLALVICANVVFAQDEKSINELREALIALSPAMVDPREAALLSETAHRTSRQCAREYGVTTNPAIHNFLIKIGKRKKGICADYTRDIGAKLKELRFKTLVLHWGTAWAKQFLENNALVVTARNQPFTEGIVLDGWRRGGRLFWSKVKDDREYDSGQNAPLAHLRRPTGITAWKEDLQETALLQQYSSAKSDAKLKKSAKQKAP